MNNDSTSATQAITEHSGLVAVLADLQRQGWRATELWDGEEWVPIQSTWSADEIAEHAAETELSRVRFLSENRAGHEGMMLLVWGNSPIELIADMTMTHGFAEAVERAQRTVWPHYPDDEAAIRWTCPKCGSADVSAEGGVKPLHPVTDSLGDGEAVCDDTCEMTCNTCQHQDSAMFFADDLDQL
ncbi:MULTISPECIES: hypothetical protein [Pseudomonas]|uniref:hypothetical protein n=1 Tax=Pseudomonas TaxID=286 RepID=UPI000BCC01BE|nr:MULTISPECIES: hypothetical protein [Pseudomonas]OYT76233.1 MAG: hypothetical protein CFE48_26830 [Pseudomonas sp. PGPPP2]UUW72380.1 hypothetical protein NRG74_02945 [Pseudomonas psychrotolerans]